MTPNRITKILCKRETWTAAELHETFGVSAKGCRVRAKELGIKPRYIINGMKFWTWQDAERLLPSSPGAWASSMKQAVRRA